MHAIGCIVVVAVAAMATLQYYVGAWSCRAGAPGTTPGPSTATYTLVNDVLHEKVHVPPSGSMKSSYAIEMSTAWDAKNNRYVSTWLNNRGEWSVSYAKPWNGNTENWYEAASSATLEHSQNVRVRRNRFTFVSFPSLTSRNIAFEGYCTRLR